MVQQVVESLRMGAGALGVIALIQFAMLIIELARIAYRMPRGR